MGGRVDLPTQSFCQVNQTLPSGPAVIPAPPIQPQGERVNSLMAWVVGLISPIWCDAPSVNQRLPSGPGVIFGAGTAGREGERADGVSGRVDHPDRVGRELGEPDVAVGAGRDPDGWRWRWGSVNKLMA